MARTITFIGKPDCHLCEDARETVGRVVAGLPEDARPVIEDRSILSDLDLRARYAEYIPVVLIDGVQHAHFRVEADRLRAALTT